MRRRKSSDFSPARKVAPGPPEKDTSRERSPFIWKDRAFQHFHELLQEVVKPYPVKQLAPRLGLTPNALYKYLEGVNRLPAELLRVFYRETQERALFDFVLQGTDFELVEELSDDDAHKLGRDWVVELVDNVGKVLSAVSGIGDDIEEATSKEAMRAVCAIRELRLFLLPIERGMQRTTSQEYP